MGNSKKKQSKLSQSPPTLFAAAVIVAAALTGVESILINTPAPNVVQILELIVVSSLALLLFVRGAKVSRNQNRRFWSALNILAIVGIAGFVLFLLYVAYSFDTGSFI